MNQISRTSVFHVEGISRDELDRQTDAIADALIDLEESWPALLDSAVAVDFAHSSVEITVTVEHHGLAEGRAVADSCINTAINMAGGKVSGDEPEMQRTSESAELVVA